MSTLGERLKLAREKSGFKQTQVKDRTNINNKTLSGYENNVSEPDSHTLSTLADLYEVSYRWLLTGRGSMKDASDHPNPKQLNADTDNIVKRLDYYKEKIAKEFPDVDLMFKDLESFTAEEMKEVYEYIKFKKSQKK
ncbi:helix-turn-helix domain-containing protein [Oceanobacillus sp. M60]